MSHPPRPLAGALLAASAVLALATPALAQAPTTTTSSTTTTTRPGDPGTTTTTRPGGPSTTTTTRPGSPLPTPSTTSTTRPGAKGSTTTSSTTSSTTTTTIPGQVPPDVQAMIDAYPRTPAGSTRELVAMIGALPPRIQAESFGRFPVAGLASWSDDWLYPRHVPDFHVHQGTDVFAAYGTTVHAPALGTATVSEGSIGGLSVKVTQADGTYWYLAHLSEALVADGAAVTPGQVVGRVGDSGNAKGGAAHVHVEVHPLGGAATDPKAYLDQAYAEALAAAPARVAYYRAGSLAWTNPDRIDRAPRTTLVVSGGPSCSLDEAGPEAEHLSTSTHFDS